MSSISDSMFSLTSQLEKQYESETDNARKRQLAKKIGGYYQFLARDTFCDSDVRTKYCLEAAKKWCYLATEEIDCDYIDETPCIQSDISRFRHKPSHTLDDIVISSSLKDALLKSALSSEAGLTPDQNILLYGEPGNGKTYIAEGLAGSLGVAFYQIKASTLLSKYFSQSAKNISQLFATIRSSNEKAMIFIDEFEVLTRERNSETSNAESQVITTILDELDGIDSKSSSNQPLIVAATNKSELIDHAILTRFSYRIPIDYPGIPEAAAIIVHEVNKANKSGKIQTCCTSQLSQHIASIAVERNFSGRDISHLVATAVNMMIDSENQNYVQDLLQLSPEQRSSYDRWNSRYLNEDDFMAAFSVLADASHESCLIKGIGM